MFDTDSPPEAPVWYRSDEASAWESGWRSGAEAAVKASSAEVEALRRQLATSGQMELTQSAEIKALRADAERWSFFRQLIKDDKLRAQALVWESGGSRRQFTMLIDEARRKQ